MINQYCDPEKSAIRELENEKNEEFDLEDYMKFREQFANEIHVPYSQEYSEQSEF